MISCVKFLKEKEIERKRYQWQPSFLSSPDITLPRMVCSFTIMHPIIKAIISANDLSAGTFSHAPTESPGSYLRYCVAGGTDGLAAALAGLHELISRAACVAGSPEHSTGGKCCKIKLTPLLGAWVPWGRVAGEAGASSGLLVLGRRESPPHEHAHFSMHFVSTRTLLTLVLYAGT